MEEVKTNAGQGLGIAGLILGIVAIPLAVSGCVSILGLILGITGIILSAVGLSQANRSNGSKGLPTGGLVVSIVGTAIALMWMAVFARLMTEGGKWWAREGKQIIEQIDEDFGQEIEQAFEDLGEELETIGEELEDKLEDLEYDIEIHVDVDNAISREEIDEVLQTYENLIGDYVEMVKKADAGDVNSLAAYVKIAKKAEELEDKLEDVSSKFTAEQTKKFEKLQEKYKKAVEEAAK